MSYLVLTLEASDPVITQFEQSFLSLTGFSVNG